GRDASRPDCTPLLDSERRPRPASLLDFTTDGRLGSMAPATCRPSAGERSGGARGGPATKACPSEISSDPEPHGRRARRSPTRAPGARCREGGFEELEHDVARAQQQRPVRTAPNAAASPGMPAAAGPIIAKSLGLPGGPCLL